MLLSAATAAPSAAPPAPKRKGERTREAVLDAALAMAGTDGLEGLTIGVLAARLGMSKSGLIAHFGTREALQLAVLQRYADRFVDEVLRPALPAPRGLPRLRRILDGWLAQLVRELEGGCLMIAGAIEYDTRPGPLRDAVVRIIEGWKAEIRRALQHAKAEGQLRSGFDSGQFVFEVYGLMLMLHQDARLARSPASVQHARAGLARLLADAAAEPLPSRRPRRASAPAPEPASRIRSERAHEPERGAPRDRRTRS